MNKYDLSILIPARNEMFLARTIEDILKNSEGKTEVIFVLPQVEHLEQCPEIVVPASSYGYDSVLALPEPVGVNGKVMFADPWPGLVPGETDSDRVAYQ